MEVVFLLEGVRRKGDAAPSGRRSAEATDFAAFPMRADLSNIFYFHSEAGQKVALQEKNPGFPSESPFCCPKKNIH